MIAVYIVIGLVAGFLITFLIMRHSSALLKQDQTNLNQQVEDLRNKLEKEQMENRNLLVENTGLKTSAEHHQELTNELKENFENERKRYEQQRLEAVREAEKLRSESDKQWQLKFEKLKEEFQNTASQLLTAKQESLKESNKEQISEILKPINEQFEAFRKSVEESKTSNEVSKKELKDTFESTLKLFAQQQNQAVETLKQETLKIGNDANNLTNALKRDTKKQGNWGEMILETLLESSGLEKDIHYFIQETVRDEEGNMLRPDVIVKFPEGRSVIIDSKVSLTAYTEAFETNDADLRRKRMKDHAKSVRKHVDELSFKKYDTVVSDSIGFILMFIPNDQCYLAAIEEDNDISNYAYNKGIVIISPSNLMMALQLANNLWKQDQRNKNLDNIIKTATDLYDKVASFSESMESVEKNITQLTTAFSKAKKQLFEGNGNIMRRVENLKTYGIDPKKQIKGLD